MNKPFKKLIYTEKTHHLKYSHSKTFFLLEISGYHRNQVFIITQILFYLSLFFKLTDYSVTELYKHQQRFFETL